MKTNVQLRIQEVAIYIPGCKRAEDVNAPLSFMVDLDVHIHSRCWPPSGDIENYRVWMTGWIFLDTLSAHYDM